jgi:hypothetical protein
MDYHRFVRKGCTGVFPPLDCGLCHGGEDDIGKMIAWIRIADAAR